MKIATFNLNGINGRLEILLRWLEQAQPDIVCLQELKAPDATFPERQLEKAGFGAIWHGQKSWNGVAILAPARCRSKRGEDFLAIRMTATVAMSKLQSIAS